ncbi:hypothetical protein [Frankia sp. Cas3]|uniref:hypothetical protein n=1 Tax=Frankia sp. Cas3 TaxID=3073926 RepID=UPI002AD2FF99|nr:hypothetical protein [Frankia sp. Cas3]
MVLDQDSPRPVEDVLLHSTGGRIVPWWDVEADDANAALALLSSFVATRTTASPIGDVCIP